MRTCIVSLVERLDIFHTPKLGSTEKEYEDASGYRRDAGGDYIRVAVSDGATVSFRSGLWARTLVQGFVNATFDTWSDEGWIIEAKADFERQNDYVDLPWHAVIKAAQGAHAAFMGLEVNLLNRTFRTFSVGDSCLLVRGKKFLIYPKRLSGSPEFTLTPELISSRNPTLPYPRKTKRRSFGDGRTDFWLMTDALAEAILDAAEFQLEEAANALRSIDDQETFRDFVDEMRASKRMKNDDVTLVHLTVGDRMG
jgi:hypothetical protein